REAALTLLRASALLFALACAACTRVGDTSADVNAGTLRIATQRSPNTLNPILSANTTEGMLNRLSFDTLLSVDPSGKHLLPILAAAVPTQANGGISHDGKTITYHLRPGVRWQDGVPFTSADVKFTWQAIMNDANNVNSRNGYERVGRVDTPDPLTVVFHLKAPFAPFVDTVFAESDNPYCILPAHVLAHYPNLNQVPFNQLPIGTGAFRVVKWVRGDHVELVANDAYFRGKPKLRRIIVRDVQDENTEINLLRTHEVDWIFEASPETINELRPLDAAGTIKLDYVDAPSTYRIYMNNSRPALRDVRVRQAIAYAIDKKLLVDRLTGGTAVVGTADQPAFSPYYEPNVTIYTPDPAKARALLTAAGYTFGSDGMAQKNGHPLSLQISYNVENATRRAIAVQVQAELKGIGIDAPLKGYPANLYFATLGQGGILTGAKYDLGVSGWTAGFDPDDNSLYGCDQFPPAGTNLTRYCSPEMERLQRSALGSYDEETRKKAYSGIQKLLARDVPDIDLFYFRFLQPINPAFKNFAPNPLNEAWNAFLWEL
ncbi:MAG TPA: peptide ABC transporter substrate-binding protein, partial [Candidatus Lustribacter sp.]|nr:peptide ABC transporter substrate-binding protein [Candidatus Lustribacter sp.]